LKGSAFKIMLDETKNFSRLGRGGKVSQGTMGVLIFVCTGLVGGRGSSCHFHDQKWGGSLKGSISFYGHFATGEVS